MGGHTVARPVLQEYVGYIQGVPSGHAGKLGPGEGETT